MLLFEQVICTCASVTCQCLPFEISSISVERYLGTQERL